MQGLSKIILQLEGYRWTVQAPGTRVVGVVRVGRTFAACVDLPSYVAFLGHVNMDDDNAGYLACGQDLAKKNLGIVIP
jgi:hypothetical protein